MNKTKMLTFSFLTVFAISQISFINSKNLSLISRTTDNPYIPYSNEATTFSGKSIDLVDQNNNYVTPGSQNGKAIAYFQIVDNANQDFFNNLSATTKISIKYDSSLSDQTSEATFYPSLSNIKRNGTYYVTFNDRNDSTSITSFNPESQFAVGSNTGALENEAVYWTEVNSQPTDQKAQFTHYAPATNEVPYIEAYNGETDDFQMGALESNGDLTFTIKVHNWDGSYEYQEPEQNIGVTLVNEDESNPFTKYEQYNAQMTEQNGEYFTYKISGLTQDTNYNFYSINYTGLTPNNDASEYIPDFDIRLNDELGIPSTKTKISTEPYIDTTTDSFKITKVGDKSIEFSLKVVDTGDKFLNSLNKNKTIDVTILNINSNNLIKTDAEFKGKKDGEFTFKIDGLNKKTTYEIISLDNTGLMINGEYDQEITIIDDLGVVEEDTMVTTESDNALIISMSILGFVILLVITFGLIYYFMSENKKAQMKSSLKGYFNKK